MFGILASRSRVQTHSLFTQMLMKAMEHNLNNCIRGFEANMKLILAHFNTLTGQDTRARHEGTRCPCGQRSSLPNASNKDPYQSTVDNICERRITGILLSASNYMKKMVKYVLYFAAHIVLVHL